MHINSLKGDLVEGPVMYDFTLHLDCDRTTWLWRYLGTTFGHFLLGSHSFRVVALGLCLKWPWECMFCAEIILHVEATHVQKQWCQN